MTAVLSIVLGLVALVPVWAVGRWVTRYDHPDDHNDIAWNLLAGVMALGAAFVASIMVYGLGRVLVALLLH